MIVFYIIIIMINAYLAYNIPPPSEIFDEDPPPIFGIVVYISTGTFIMMMILFAVNGLMELV